MQNNRDKMTLETVRVSDNELLIKINDTSIISTKLSKITGTKSIEYFTEKVIKYGIIEMDFSLKFINHAVRLTAFYGLIKTKNYYHNLFDINLSENGNLVFKQYRMFVDTIIEYHTTTLAISNMISMMRLTKHRNYYMFLNNVYSRGINVDSDDFYEIYDVINTLSESNLYVVLSELISGTTIDFMYSITQKTNEFLTTKR